MNKKIILVDMDGVLADFETDFVKAWRKKFSSHPYVPAEERNTFYLSDNYQRGLEKEIDSIFTAPGFFQNLGVIKGGKEAITRMEDLGHKVFICTSPISAFENCVLEKYHWVSKNLGSQWASKMILTKDKTLIYGDILIDDKPEHLGLKKPAWQHILYEAPYNRNVPNKLRITWNNWEKILYL